MRYLIIVVVVLWAGNVEALGTDTLTGSVSDTNVTTIGSLTTDALTTGTVTTSATNVIWFDGGLTGTDTCSIIMGVGTTTGWYEPKPEIIYKEVIVYKEKPLFQFNISKEDLIMSTFILVLIISGAIFIEYKWRGISRPFVKCLGITANTMKLDAVARKFKFTFKHVPEHYDAKDIKKPKTA